jgi:GMP synthase (glutamine-hydrolysing)
MSRILYLIHDPRWTASRVTDLLVGRGVEVEYRCHQSGDVLPSVEEFGESFDGVIIGGGFVGSREAAHHPFMARQIQFTREVVDRGHRFFGICLGAQILGAAFGARTDVRPDRRAEFGFWPVTATAAGAGLFDRSTHVFQAHDEGLLELPAGAELLAEGEWFPIQAFRIGPNAYGVQFHPDATADAVESWWHHNTRLQDRVGAQPLADQLRDTPIHDSGRLRWLNRFLDHWLSPNPTSSLETAPSLRTDEILR